LTACEETITPDQYGVIQGSVRDFSNDSLVPEVILTTTAANAPFLSDSTGSFLLENVLVGEYTLSVRKSGYRNASVSFSVTENDTTVLDLTLEGSPNNNEAPNTPTSPFPENQAQYVARNITLSWSASDPDRNDSLRFNVILIAGNSQNQELIGSEISDTTIELRELDFSTTYYWQVEVIDPQGLRTKGPIWSFETEELPDYRTLYARLENGRYGIYTTLSDSSELQLSESGESSWQPRLDPQRERIAFARTVGNEPFLFLMNVDGSDVQQLSPVAIAGNHNPGRGFSWSPNGQQIIFGHYNQLYAMNRDGSGPYALGLAPADRHIRTCSWSPLSDYIALETVGTQIFDTEIYLLHRASGQLNLVVDNAPGITASPTFTPDGQCLLYTHDASGLDRINGRQFDTRIYLLRLSDLSVVDLSINKPNGTNDLYPRPSPTGAQIIFVNTPNDGQGPDEVWIMDIDGTNREKIADGTMPDWQ